jgi:hypothetical protein
MLKCGYCGKDNPNSAAHCQGCGTSLLFSGIDDPGPGVLFPPTKSILKRDLFPRDSAVRERIRGEVYEEFAAAIKQSTGMRKWWLLLRRRREISRRIARLIYYQSAGLHDE